MKLSSIAWNAAGLGVPLVAALAAIPPLLHTLGNERFGILSLAWGLTAIAGAFDLGIGRAATRQLSDHLAHGRQANLLPTARSAARLALFAGLSGGVLFALAIGGGVYHWLSFSSELESQIITAGLLLALTVPLQASIATYRGVSEACQRFRGINVIRMGIGVANFLFPLIAAQFTNHVDWLVGSLLASRVLAWFAYRHLALSHLGSGNLSETDAHNMKIETASLMRSGGWLTVSAVVGPLLVQADRFFLASQASVADVPTYTVPFDIVTQLFLVVTAVSTVAFPTIARIIGTDPNLAWRLFREWSWRVTGAMALVASAAALILPHVFPWWVGSTLSVESVLIGQILCIGLVTHSIGVMCFAFLHAAGRFRATALINIAEMPFYFAALPWLIAAFGVKGAAVAWALRVTLDAAALYFLCAREARTRLVAVSNSSFSQSQE